MNVLQQFYPGDFIAWTAAIVLVQIAVVIAVAALLARLIVRFGAAGRYGVWLCALVCILLCPLLTIAGGQMGLAIVEIPILEKRVVVQNPAAVQRDETDYGVVTSKPEDAIDADEAIGDGPVDVSKQIQQLDPIDADQTVVYNRAPEEPKREEKPDSAQQAGNGIQNVVEGDDTAKSSMSALEVIRTSVGGMTLLWACGTLLLLANMLRGLRCARVLRCAAQPLDEARFADLLARVRQRLETRHPAGVAVSPHVAAPLVIGWRRPTVLVPAPLLSALSEAELEDLLVHECAHVLRRDLVVGFLQRSLAVFCWLHPLIHYLNRQLSRAREEVCDNHVLRGGDARRYAGTLLTVAKHIPAAGALSPGIGLLSPHWKLEDRVAGLLDKGRNIMTRTNRVLLLFLFAALVITDIVIVGVRLGEATADEPAETPALAAMQPALLSAVTDDEETAVETPEQAVVDSAPVSVAQALGDGRTIAATSTAAAASEAQLTMKATILLPDGSPAAQAVVHSTNNIENSIRTVTADGSGKFELQDFFVSSLKLHILSADGSNQKVVHVAGAAVRSHIAKPLTITLEPSVAHHVRVTANGQPVEAAHVGISGSAFQSAAGSTKADGTAVVWCPSGESINSVVAWHRKLGVNGIRSTPDAANTELSLLAPKKHVVRILDVNEKPVAGLAITASIRMTDTGWILTRGIDASRQTTDENGEVRFDWFPAQGVKYVDVTMFDRGWKRDKTDQEKVSDGLTTMHWRKEFPIKGRIVVPDGADAEGILITGRGFGVGNMGDIPYARTRKDGTFTMSVPAGHGFIIGISDLQWSSDLWTGVILRFADGKQQEIVLKAYPATPLEFRVTRGSSREPIANAWLDVSRSGHVNFVDESGESRYATSGISGWLRTDENGFARTGVGRGEVELRIGSGGWSEEKTIDIKSDEPVSVSFHREWLGNRVLEARPVVDGVDFTPSADAVALAWSRRSWGSHMLKAKVRDDGIVEVEFDEKELKLLLLDRKKHVSGFVEVGSDDVKVELTMQANASFSGTFVDGHDDSPLVDRTVQLVTYPAFLEVVEKQQTDSQGRFHFTEVAAGAPLRLIIKREHGKPDYTLFRGNRLFKPGENRTSDVAKAELMDGNRAVDRRKPTKRTIAERMQRAADDSRAMGLRTIAILEGDESKRVRIVAARLRNIDEVESVSRYLPVTVTAQQLPDQAESLADLKWPTPTKEEVVLVYSVDGKAATAVLRLSCGDVDSAFERGKQFIQRHQPATRDGRKLLGAAQREAKASQRNVWLIIGGPRCDPCFRLARWIKQHQEVLEKDLVIVKITSGLDEHANDIKKEFGGEGHGIPFHALLSPDNEVLMTSEGPLGNIGMPGTVESIRHFQAMLESAKQRMTSTEIGELIDSLSED